MNWTAANQTNAKTKRKQHGDVEGQDSADEPEAPAPTASQLA
jgi:hypothetical protein